MLSELSENTKTTDSASNSANYMRSSITDADKNASNTANSSASLALLFQSNLQLFAQLNDTNNAFVIESTDNLFLQFGNLEGAQQKGLSSFLSSIKVEANIPQIIECPSSLLPLSSNSRLLLVKDVNKETNSNIYVGSFLQANNINKTDTSINSSKNSNLLNLALANIRSQYSLYKENARLQELQYHQQQLSELNQDFICVKDKNHKIVYANGAYIDTFPEQMRDKLIGSTVLNFYEPHASAQQIESDLVALQKGFSNTTQLQTLANGEEKILNISKKSFTGLDGKTYLMSVSRDVTEREVLINDLKRSNSDLDNFAYVASHDLRSPLNVIKRLVTWIGEDCADILPQESKEDLELVLNRASRMEKLLVDLLSYSRIGKEYQEAGEVNLRELVVELLSLIDLPMGFVVNCDDLNILVPRVPFNVVMLNLVSNAIKHHDSGNAKIEIKAKRNQKESVITVMDNGPGIAAKDRGKVFQLFETLRPRDEVEGSGMGLSVVKKIVEHYGGNIEVADNEPRGTKFIVTWPTKNIARTVLDNLND